MKVFIKLYAEKNVVIAEESNDNHDGIDMFSNTMFMKHDPTVRLFRNSSSYTSTVKFKCKNRDERLTSSCKPYGVVEEKLLGSAKKMQSYINSPDWPGLAWLSRSLQMLFVWRKYCTCT